MNPLKPINEAKIATGRQAIASSRASRMADAKAWLAISAELQNLKLRAEHLLAHPQEIRRSA